MGILAFSNENSTDVYTQKHFQGAWNLVMPCHGSCHDLPCGQQLGKGYFCNITHTDLPNSS